MPEEFRFHPDRLERNTEVLVREGLIKPLRPAESISDPQKSSADFLNWLDAAIPSVHHRLQRYGQRIPIPIHLEKMEWVAKELADRNLAQRVGPWYHVERRVAMMLMAYLAGGIAAPDREAVPATDKLLYFGQRLVRTPWSSISARRAGTRAALLRNVLPAPGVSVWPDQLISFKRRHGRLLCNFRRHVEELALDIASSPDDETRQEKEQAAKFNLSDMCIEVESRMREERWAIFGSGSLLSIAGAALSLGRGLWIGDLSIAASASFSILGALVAARASSRRADWRKSPVAYAVVANRRFDAAAPV